MADGNIPDDLKPYAVMLYNDLPFFSKTVLKIRDKQGNLVPLIFNRAQKYIHQQVEDQRRRTGRVRKVIVKGRKQGSSTYVEARCFHAVWRPGSKAPQAFILTHEQDATDTIFRMAQTFHNELPAAAKPTLKTSNSKELIFEDNKSGYRVATAGSSNTGRSATYQYFHGSEVPLWPNAETHVAGAMRTVGNLPGTEIFLEATGNGIGNVFYRYVMAAIRGNSEFELIFVPWFWDDTLRLDCPSAFKPSNTWIEYATIHKLEWDQLYWAYVENRGLATAISASPDEPCWLFKQEFPSTVDEAFQTDSKSFIPGGLVLRARHPVETIIGHGPIILGVDPARIRDKVGVIDRCGRRMGEKICERIDPGGSTEYVTSQIASIIRRICPDMCNIDVSEGTGAAVYESLCGMGWADILTPVSFGSRPIGRGPTGERMYENRRAEMWDEMRDWFSGELPVQIPDDEGLQGDITSPQWGPQATRYNSGNNALVLEKKDRIKERLGASPDLGDAAALTFATPYAVKTGATRPIERKRRPSSRGGY